MSMPAPGSPELELTCTPAMRPWSASIKLVPLDLVISDVLSTPSEPATFFLLGVAVADLHDDVLDLGHILLQFDPQIGVAADHDVLRYHADKQKVRTDWWFLTLMAKRPLVSVVVPLVVPCSITLAPAIGSPVAASSTVPVTRSWA